MRKTVIILMACTFIAPAGRAASFTTLPDAGVASVSPSQPASAPPLPPEERPTRAVTEGDGMLLQRVLVAVYFAPGEQERTRLGMLEREVRQFEAYLWRYSGRKVRVEAELVPIDRPVGEADLEGEDPRWGWALTRTRSVDDDLRHAGYSASRHHGLILLFDPPSDRPCLAAGLTWHRERYSSVPLKENLFEGSGHRYPLHLVMVHEYLHQIDSAFEEAGRATGFEDPDRVGRPAGAACVLPGDEYPFFATALQQDELCRPPAWQALDGRMGIWISR